MKRTQLYIDAGLFRVLEKISSEKNTTISDLVRKAIQRVYGRKPSPQDRLKALQAGCGVWKNRDDLPNTEVYLRGLRRNTRAKRLALK